VIARLIQGPDPYMHRPAPPAMAERVLTASHVPRAPAQGDSNAAVSPHATRTVLTSVDELVATERPEEPMHCLHPA